MRCPPHPHPQTETPETFCHGPDMVSGCVASGVPVMLAKILMSDLRMFYLVLIENLESQFPEKRGNNVPPVMANGSAHRLLGPIFSKFDRLIKGRVIGFMQAWTYSQGHLHKINRKLCHTDHTHWGEIVLLDSNTFGSCS